jgi:hypothetical protein
MTVVGWSRVANCNAFFGDPFEGSRRCAKFPDGAKSFHDTERSQSLGGKPVLKKTHSRGTTAVRRAETLHISQRTSMHARELAEKFRSKVAAAVVERGRQADVASANAQKRSDDVEHCKNAFDNHVIPLLSELKNELGEEQFSFALQIDRQDHRPVGVTFRIGDGAATNITSALGNIVVTRNGASGSFKGVPHVYSPEEEPFISNSGDLTRDKIAKLVEMSIDNAGG